MSSAGSGGGSSSSKPMNEDDIFNKFYGFGSPETVNFPRFQFVRDGLHPFGEGSLPRKDKAPPMEKKLLCSLEELYSGSTRKLKISRTVISCHGRHVQEQEVLNIEVKAGWKKGTKITYPDKGDELPDQLPADLVLIIDEKPHETYERDGNDLILRKTVSLGEALGGTTLNITTLDRRNLSIPVQDIITPGYEITLPREGMPIAKEPGKRGVLKIKFEVKFPARLAPELRARLKRDLAG